jgi:hypothetical protein
LGPYLKNLLKYHYSKYRVQKTHSTPTAQSTNRRPQYNDEPPDPEVEPKHDLKEEEVHRNYDTTAQKQQQKRQRSKIESKN